MIHNILYTSYIEINLKIILERITIKMSTERFDLQTASFEKMADFFYTNGYVILDNALSPDVIESLKNDLYNVHNST